MNKAAAASGAAAEDLKPFLLAVIRVYFHIFIVDKKKTPADIIIIFICNVECDKILIACFPFSSRKKKSCSLLIVEEFMIIVHIKTQKPSMLYFEPSFVHLHTAS